MIALAALVVGEAPWAHRLVVASAVLAPLPTALVLTVVVARGIRRRSRPAVGQDAAALLEVLASLQAGMTLRPALAGLSREVERLVAVGAATDDLAVAVRGSLGEHGAMAGAAVRLLDRVGGPASPVIEELAAQAAETARVRQELRAAVAAPVLQGVLVGGVPMAALLSMVVSGGFGTTLAASPAHALTVLVGSVMTLAGVAWVFVIVRRSLP